MSLFLPVLALVSLVLVQPLLLQFAVAITGEAAPKFGRAFGTVLIAGLVSLLSATAWGCTVGALVGAINGPLAATVSALVALATTAVVYRSRLRTGLLHAFVIALIHQVLAAVLSGATWFVFGWFA